MWLRNSDILESHRRVREVKSNKVNLYKGLILWIYVKSLNTLRKGGKNHTCIDHTLRTCLSLLNCKFASYLHTTSFSKHSSMVGTRWWRLNKYIIYNKQLILKDNIITSKGVLYCVYCTMYLVMQQKNIQVLGIKQGQRMVS